jgi:hypothetical protein
VSHLPDGTHTVVIGYSLGANATPSVANNSKYIDLIIALQPSMLSWNPPFTGKVGRVIEVYNPNTWMTFGGMGSKKLVGDNINIEYIANNDSHPGAQFNSDFRNLVKTEIAKFTAADRQEIAQAQMPVSLKPAPPSGSPALGYAEEQPAQTQKDPGRKNLAQKDLTQKNSAANDRRQIAQVEMPKAPKPPQLEQVALALPQQSPQQQPGEQPRRQPRDLTALAAPRDLTDFLDGLSSSVSSGDLFAERQLTLDDMKGYAERTYHGSPSADSITTASQ